MMKMGAHSMNLLAFDTGTEMMSIAVSRTVAGQVQHWQHTGSGGAQTSTGLIPAILALMQDAGLQLTELDAICFGSGPGSFTGLRTACSVAQGLAFGANVPVLAVDSLLAVAEEARHAALATQARGVVTAMLDARMDELYAATYSFVGDQWTELQTSALVRPEDLGGWVAEDSAQVKGGGRRPGDTEQNPLPPNLPAREPTAWAMAGNVFAVYGERLAVSDPGAAAPLRIPALPTALAMLRLAPQLLAAGGATAAAHAMPRYIRDKVAKTTAERAAEKAAALGASAA